MAINDTSLLSIIGTVAGQRHIHTLHFRLGAAVAEADLIGDWETNCLTSYLAMFQSGDTPVETMRCQQVCGTVPLRAAVEDTPSSGVGTYDANGATLSDWAAPWLANYVSERTAFAGRSYRGRFFLGGLNEAWFVGPILTTNAQGSSRLQRQATYLTALGRYLGTGLGVIAGFMLVVHSPKLAAVPGNDCQDSSTRVTSLVASNVLTTMKSRKAGHGD